MQILENVDGKISFACMLAWTDQFTTEFNMSL